MSPRVTLATAARVLTQLRRDPRTIALHRRRAVPARDAAALRLRRAAAGVRPRRRRDARPVPVHHDVPRHVDHDAARAHDRHARAADDDAARASSTCCSATRSRSRWSRSCRRRRVAARVRAARPGRRRARASPSSRSPSATRCSAWRSACSPARSRAPSSRRCSSCPRSSSRSSCSAGCSSRARDGRLARADLRRVAAHLRVRRARARDAGPRARRLVRARPRVVIGATLLALALGAATLRRRTA